MKASFWAVAVLAVAIVGGVYFWYTRANNSADLLPFDPAYTDGASIDQALSSEDGQIGSSIDQDLNELISDSNSF